MLGEQLVIAGDRPVTAAPDRCGHHFPNPTGAMVANHHISQLLINERVADLHRASGGHRAASRRPRAWRMRSFALTRRRAIKPISSSPS
jgi:hypothetical protein